MPKIALALLIVWSAAPAVAGDVFADAAKALEAGDAEKATTRLLDYGRKSPGAPLANQALDVVLLLVGQKVTPEAVAPYVRALGTLAAGDAEKADGAFRAMAADEKLAWPVRGRAAMVAAQLNKRGDRVEILAAAWEGCNDETARLLAVALADAYYKAGDAKAAAEVRDDFARRFPDEKLKYFDYLPSPAEDGAP